MIVIKRFTFFVPLFFLIFAGCVGCPYSFSGASVPPHLRTVAIPYADDRSGTGEARMRELITNKLIRKVIDDNNLKIAERGKSDAVVEMAIVSLNDAPGIVTSGESVKTRRITLSVQVLFKDLVKRKNLIDKQYSNYADYLTSGSASDRLQAIETALDKITDDILLDMVSGW